MPVWKMQCAFGADGGQPRDKAVITPHFNDQGVGSDPQALCDDLAAALATWASSYTPRQVEVTAYDAQGSAPVYPQGYAAVNVGSVPAATIPREIAVCLSFFSGQNRPRYRGRVYIPLFIVFGDNACKLRPDATTRNKVAELAPVFADLGGVDVDWCVYSRADDAARSVSNWWVDDEWDTMRSRGLRPTTRTAGSVSE
jgi:hypothetical protein